jgi:cytochrome c551/c552
MRLTGCCALVLTIALGACGESSRTETPEHGNAERGRLLLRQYGCGSCHRIPGVAVADGNVGPPLDRVGRQVYLAGVLPNSPANMVRWIRAPQAIKPQTMMPNLQVGEAHATDMVAHLYRLR